tara:strand:- start:306 stop:1055 length:750 start_codon:yes stop_codon:yes gene_type:complete
MQKIKTKIHKASIYQFESFFHLDFLTDSISSSYDDNTSLSKIYKIIEELSLSYIDIIHYDKYPTLIPFKYYDQDIKSKYLETNLNLKGNINEDISDDKEVAVVYSRNKDLSKILSLDNKIFSHTNQFTKLYNYLSGIVKNLDGLSFFININSKSFEIIIFNKNEFLFFNSFEIVDENEYLYYTFFVLKNFQSSYINDKIIFLGKYEKFEKFYNLTSKYSKIDFIENDIHNLLNFKEHFFSILNENNIRK